MVGAEGNSHRQQTGRNDRPPSGSKERGTCSGARREPGRSVEVDGLFTRPRVETIGGKVPDGAAPSRARLRDARRRSFDRLHRDDYAFVWRGAATLEASAASNPTMSIAAKAIIVAIAPLGAGACPRASPSRCGPADPATAARLDRVATSRRLFGLAHAAFSPAPRCRRRGWSG